MPGIPASLPPPAAKPMSAAVIREGIQVRHEKFLAAILTTLRFQLVAHMLCFRLPAISRLGVLAA